MEKKIIKEIKKYEKNTKKKNYSWIIKVTLFATLTSFAFSYGSEVIITKLNIYISIILLLLIILFGVIFDMIGVAMTTVSVAPFHSMSAKKVKGSKTAIRLIDNAEKVASFCNDVVGDICGILSGSISVLIATKLSAVLNTNIFFTTLILTSAVTGLTIGGKALGKSVAINKNVFITYNVSKVLNVFKRR